MKKLTSIILTMLIIISTLPIQITANAEETNETDPATEETGYSLNMPFYLNDQEARCFLGFLFNTRELTQEQITNGNAYAFLTGQLSGDAEIESAFAFKDLMDAQLSRVVSTYEYGTEVGRQWMLDYLYLKAKKTPNLAQSIVSETLHTISSNGIDYILDEYTVHGGPLQEMEFEYIQDGRLIKGLYDKITSVPGKVDYYKKMILALAGSAFYAGGINRLEMYKYFLFCKENMVYKHKYSEDIYQLVLSQQGLNEHIVAIKAIQPTLANWDFLDENILLWGTEERMALMEKWADFAYCMEEGLAQFPNNQFVDEEESSNPSNPTQPQTEPETQPTTVFNETYTGTTGDCTWVLDSYGTLTISGNGYMKNYSGSYDVSWFRYREKIKRVIIDNGIKNIGSYSFYNCINLSDISIPDSIQTIGDHSFCYCSSLISLNLPEDVKSIVNYSFYGCLSLTSVFIPKNVATIGPDCFTLCPNLKKFIVDKDNSKFTSNNGVLFNYNQTVLIKYPEGKADLCYVIPNSVKGINGDSFNYCDNIDSVILSEQMNSINSYSFRWCSNLKRIFIPSNITQVGYYAFEGCTNLDHVIYQGSNDQWDAIFIDKGNNSFIAATRYYNYLKTIIEGHSISLNGDIGVNYYIDAPDEDIENSKVTVDFTWIVNGEEKSYSVILIPEDKTDYGYKATCPIPVAEMTYDVTAVVTIDGVLQSKPDTYSVQKYAKVIMNNENNFKENNISAENSAGRNGEQRYNDLVTLVQAMLDYGTKAQINFDRNTDNLANEGTDFFTDSTDSVSADSITSTEENMDMDLSEYGLQYKGSTVVYLSETSIRHYYYVTDWDIFNKVKDSVIFDGAAVGYTEKDGAIYFEKKGVSAPNLDTPYALAIKDKTCKYSVNDYIRRCLASDKVSNNTKELVKATYRYNVAANTYFEI